ncbi:MAG: glycosyltransferase [Thermoplasmata archaeon]|nr:glycosyltransferase [Thermoplasmata archaeon]
MNICMISQYLPNIGGIENIVSDLSQRLVKEGHNVSVVAPAYPDTISYDQIPGELNGVKVYRFKMSRRFPFGLDELRNMHSIVIKADGRENALFSWHSDCGGI